MSFPVQHSGVCGYSRDWPLANLVASTNKLALNRLAHKHKREQAKNELSEIMITIRLIKFALIELVLASYSAAHQYAVQKRVQWTDMS